MLKLCCHCQVRKWKIWTKNLIWKFWWNLERRMKMKIVSIKMKNLFQPGCRLPTSGGLVYPITKEKNKIFDTSTHHLFYWPCITPWISYYDTETRNWRFWWGAIRAMSKKEDEKDLDMENDTWNDGELLSVQFIFMMFF